MLLRNKDSFYIINLTLTIIIGVVFCYSYFFYPNNQPITCFYKLKTGLNCNSCGFSRAFSAYLHLEFKNGIAYNPKSWYCFLFILSQFVLRITYIILPIYHVSISKPYIAIETTLTILFFLLSFGPLLH